MDNNDITTVNPGYRAYFDEECDKLLKDIYTKNMCIHRFLWRFQNILISSAAILYGRFKGEWRTIYQLYYNEECKSKLSGRLKIPNQGKLEEISQIGRWSDEYIKIEDEQKKERINRSIFIPIHIQHVFESDKNCLCLLAFIKPTRDLYEDAELKSFKVEGYGYFSEMVSRLTTQWFAWKSYQNQLCNSFSSQAFSKKFKEDELDQLDKERNKILERLFWPTPLKNYMYILENGWNSLTPSEKAPKNWNRPRNWSRAMRERLCLEHEELHCKEEGIHNLCCKCAEQKDSEVFEELVTLIPYLKIEEWDWYLEKREEGFHKLSKLTQYFYQKINLDNLEKRSLLCFFAYNFWSDYMNQVNWNASEFGPSELGKCLLHCINISFQLLAETSTKENYIDSLIWAISRYGHEVLDIEPRLDIGAHLLYLARGESALHSLKTFYRDHFFHTIEVCFLGHLLLDSMVMNDGKCLWEYAAEYMHVSSKNEVLQEWYVAALFHDIGYAMEIFNSVCEAMKFFKSSQGLSTFSDKLSEALVTLSDQLDGCFNFTKADEPQKDHGIIGAEHINSLVAKIRKTKPEVEAYSYACSAIANHNHRKNTVTFAENPIAFLLVLCDTLQEWNRLNFQHATAPSMILQRLNSFKAVDGDFFVGPLERACVNLKKECLNKDYISLLDYRTLKFTLIYSNEINKDSGVFTLWLDSICNLQRLNMEGLPIKDIELQLVTPLYSNGGKSEHQLHRLREAATETHMNFLHDFFPNQDIENGSTNHAITYYPDACNIPEADHNKLNLSNKEALILSLRQLTKRKRITGTMRDFYDKLKRWRRYNEDREFKGDYDSEIPG